VVFLESGQSSVGGADIWKAPLDGADRTPVRLLATESAEINGQVSPNGEWLAYESTMTGRSEVWVQPFKQEGRREQVSREGGTMPRWSRDGRELFFTTILGDAMMMAGVSGGSFATPRLLFEGRYRGQSNANTNYDIARDGRFLHIQQVQPDTAPTRIEIVLNGLTGLAVRR
jgi:Tol biopolymer transport system component